MWFSGRAKWIHELNHKPGRLVHPHGSANPEEGESVPSPSEPSPRSHEKEG